MKRRPRRDDERPVRKKNQLSALGVRADGRNPVDYKDVQLLRQFLSDKGRIRSRRLTGLTPQQQRQVATAIRNAREMALLPYNSR
ncbi:30S ribosomal protein S18 [Gordonia rubripertincta]|uniref:Small ribosomal subunit protein bS18 n=2 Tax=Gordonia rubripertincta TaxID=36822 RepID=A0AAW4FYS0_GORRU|nr:MULTISPECIES: 30S ribosomal protein S18 [Gordonia]ASR00858.1 30S ribosomal protein S18 1 [Gordonia rubripertincta]MBM7276159.1 30S ribosomal protein S18 [Gordonia rubripertincta]MCK8613911.1 30S ribosomal protein S18 [Gordonia sp. C13]MDG6782815.1 30S ribosomal protein S18 [Gordonia rubripertincta]NKY64024.1 30S ribosomal protein S18 [Gordonia rubripertincta]